MAKFHILCLRPEVESESTSRRDNYHNDEGITAIITGDRTEIAEQSEVESDGACIVRGRWQRRGAHEGFLFASLIRFFH